MEDTDYIITKKSIILIIAVWILSIGIVYIAVWRGVYNLNPLNLMCDWEPWRSLGFHKEGIYTSDTADALIPRIYNVYNNRESIFWNRYVGFGVASSPDVYLNPFNLLFVLPMKYAILFKSILKFSMAYFGMCLLLKQLKCKDMAAVMGAVTYAYSSAMVMWHFWHHTEVMMMAPWALMLGDKLIHKKRNLEMFWLAIIIFIMVVVGMPTYAAYVLYILGFYILINTIWEYKKDIRSIFGVYFRFAGSVVLGIIMSLPYIIYTYNTVVSNGYTEKRLRQSRSTLDPIALRTFILPLYNEGLKHHLNETTVYVGVFALLMLLFVFIRFTKKKQLFWLISSIIIAIFAYTHWLDFIFKRIPAVNSSLKTRVISALCFTMSVLAAIQLDDILKNKEIYKKKWYLRYPIYLANFLLYGYIFMNHRDVTDQLRNIAFLGIIIVGLEGYILFSRKTIKAICCCMTIVACVLNMTLYIGGYLPYSDSKSEIIPEPTETIKYLQDNLGDRRYIPVGSGWMLFPNSNVFYKLHNVVSHDLH
ncbi:MAG: YfhO family protein, partial [Eubacterium sp.]|nr:YfhO family protein [Eubacterium sp.]